MKWFGDPWPSEMHPSPVCEEPNDRVGTPEGELCLWCDEPIGEYDRGIIMPCVDLNTEGAMVTRTVPCHIECNVRQVVGSLEHVNGVCSCVQESGETTSLSPREEALAVWDWVQEHG